MVKPILLYGAEVWGYGNLEIVELSPIKILKVCVKHEKLAPRPASDLSR